MARPPKTVDPARPPPRLRRAYYDCRYGQLHLHNAIPSGGGFDELTAVLCVHGSNETGRAFVPVLGALGLERSVYAPDLPGYGESDPAAGQSFLEAGVNALTDFLDSMRIRSVDLLVRGDGAGIAQQLAKLRGAGVRRVVLLTAAEAASPDLPQKLLAALGGTQPT
ncbi:MAG TPA: alpha/beta fold hydrolase [Steroidobacteraceae bacterium]|nr:alpha/beta fold hydrolase [Steroidobacteraceae bacterium]